MIKDGMERNHSKVQVAALELFTEAFLACPAVFEDALMDLLPPALVLSNARNQQAQIKAVALRDELGRRLPAGSLCPAIVHSIRSVRPPVPHSPTSPHPDLTCCLASHLSHMSLRHCSSSDL